MLLNFPSHGMLKSECKVTHFQKDSQNNRILFFARKVAILQF